LNHDDPKQSIIITAAFPKDTQPQHGLISNIVIPPNQMVHEQVVAIVSPIVGEKGKPWTGRIILTDQFHRRYKTQKATFRWVG